ncbi:MAG TPA: DedA family protein [Acidimicrobiales bacterium]|nr:DedA family protein [Acidimicrobiales bacterium]
MDQRVVDALVEPLTLAARVAELSAVMASISSWFQHHLLALHGPAVYAVIGLLVFFEVAIIIGFFFPGEIATIVGGVVASQHHANLIVMIVVVVVSATAGNVCGYELGKVIGDRVLDTGRLARNRGVVRAKALVERAGGPAVLVGRFIALVRVVIPGVAGMTDMDRRVFILFSTTGALLWGTMWTLIGYVAGLSYVKILNATGKWSGIALVVVVVAAVSLLVWRSIREHRRDPRT